MPYISDLGRQEWTFSNTEPKFETWLLSFPTHSNSLKFQHWCILRAEMTILVYPGIEFISLNTKQVILPVPVDHSPNARRFYRG